MDSYMTVKGQIVIPSKIRQKFGIKQGTRVQVDVDEQGHRIILTPVTDAPPVVLDTDLG